MQALWASTPPQHDVVAMVAVHNPPSLWTGGTRGEIVYWKLPPDHQSSEQELWPMASLCGHAAAITDLVTCKINEVKEKRSHDSLDDKNLPYPYGMSNACEIVVSVCLEGWLCAWDSLTGRCRRRRKLPPWVGKPSRMITLPKGQRHVCISCDGSHLSFPRSSSINDGDNGIRSLVDNARTMALEKYGGINNNMRATVLVVDASTLCVLQVVYNGFVGIGPVKSIVAVPVGGRMHKVMVSDQFGRIRTWAVDEGRHGKYESGNELSEQVIPSSHKRNVGNMENTQTISFSSDGVYLLLVFSSYWVILLTENQSTILESANLELKSSMPDNFFWVGGFFLVGSSDSIANNVDNKRSLFLVWDVFGGAMLYSLQRNDDQTFATNVVCRVSTVATSGEGHFMVKFCQLKDLLMCVGCSSSQSTANSISDTWVRLWRLPLKHFPNSAIKNVVILTNDKHKENGLFEQESNSSENLVVLGQAGLRNHWLHLSVNGYPEVITMENGFRREHPQVDALTFLEPENVSCEQDESCRKPLSADINPPLHSARGKWVTASMLLFDASSIPWTYVLGFNSGGIRLIRMKVFKPSSLNRKNGISVDDRIGRYVVQCLSKHTGPIICLAEHSIAAESSSANTGKIMRRLLISGGMDCLTCVWDVEEGQLLVALHHHVTPLQQVLLPPLGTDAPWSNCFITVGEDGCIALISLETLQVERIFIGHPARPKLTAWDGIRGYLACVCASISNHAMSTDILFIWDLKSGALERILRGTAAHSMFENFLKQIQGSSAAVDLLPGRATSTASLLHGDVDSAHTHNFQSSLSHQFSRLGTKTNIEGLKSLQVASGIMSLPDDKHHEDSMLASAESASNKVIGGLEKLSSKFSQALNQGAKAAPSHLKDNYIGNSSSQSSSYRNLFHKQPPIKAASPFPGVAALQFDLFTLMAPDLGRQRKNEREVEQLKVGTDGIPSNKIDQDIKMSDDQVIDRRNYPQMQEEPLPAKSDDCELASSLGSFEGSLLRTSLAYLHLWGADLELDKCLQKELQIFQPTNVGAAAGFAGDRGATTLFLPGWKPTFELWITSSEFCALRSLTIVATALRMTTLSRLTSNASSALAAFYTRGLAEKFPRVKAPSLELYACFWQDPSEHVRMAARSLFHCAASRAIPSILCAKSSSSVTQCGSNLSESGISNNISLLTVEQILGNEHSTEKTTWPDSVSTSAEINDWLDSFEGQDWTSIVGGTSQDSRAVRIIVAAALAVWYPGLVKPELAPSVAPYLVKLVKAVIDRHSAVAAELLADGMESVWKHLISKEIPQLISDIFLLITCLSGGGSAAPNFISNPATAMTIRETLTSSLLPSLAMADVASFLHIVQTQLSLATADSSVPLVALMGIIRIIRAAPRAVVYYLTQVTSIILKTMNFGKHCYQSAMAAVREMVRVYPMVAVHQASGKLAVGDAVGDVHSLTIQVYDLNSACKFKVLDASGPPGHPALLVSDGASANIGGISALSFSDDGEGVVAFSQHGLMIRWWSLGAVWWEKLSRATAPVQCTKLVLVPPWPALSPKSSRSSIMATISSNAEITDTTEATKMHTNGDFGRAACQNVDLLFKLEWRHGNKIALLHHGQEIGVLQI